jgi:tetratricopeptide (TPR) repeat protein
MFFKKKTPKENYDLAFSHYNSKRYQSAYTSINKALEKVPDNHDFLILSANILEDGISKQRALQHYLRAWNIEKHYSTAFRIGYCSMIINENPLEAANWVFTALDLLKKQGDDQRPLMSVPIQTIFYNIGFYLIHIKDQYTIGYAMEFIENAASSGHSKANLLVNAISQNDFLTIKNYFPTIFEAFEKDSFVQYKLPIGSTLKSLV